MEVEWRSSGGRVEVKWKYINMMYVAGGAGVREVRSRELRGT